METEKLWVAIEDATTHEVSEFVQATDEQVLNLMDGHRADKHDGITIRVQDVEGGRHIVYDCVIYKGGFGYNIWVAKKYLDV